MLAGQLKQVRSELGLTQAELANRLECDRRTIIRYEDGTYPIPTAVELALTHLNSSHIPLAGVVDRKSVV
jgi:DNA-binding XRE family transcriptional regulator